MDEFTKVDRLTDLFGGVRALQSITEQIDAPIDKAVISRWSKLDGPRAGGGVVPPQYNPTIRAAARAAPLPADFRTRAKFMEEVESCLEPDACPCCGTPISEAVKINHKAMKAARLVRS